MDVWKGFIKLKQLLILNLLFSGFKAGTITTNGQNFKYCGVSDIPGSCLFVCLIQVKTRLMSGLLCSF